MKKTAVADTITISTTVKKTKKEADAKVTRELSAREILVDTVMKNTYEICGKRIASVPVELMELDETYQRVLGKTIRKLATEWNDEKCDFLIVSYRDNKFYIIDGQHRYSAAKLNKKNALPCIIFTGLTQKDEALRFAQQQDNVNKLTPYDVFKANIACGDASIPEIAVDLNIKRICDKYNIEIKKYSFGMKKRRILRCLTFARQIPDAFEWIVDIINKSNWANCPQAYAKHIMETIYAYYNDSIGNLIPAEERLIYMMNTTTPDELEAMARLSYPEYKLNNALSLCVRDLTQE